MKSEYFISSLVSNEPQVCRIHLFIFFYFIFFPWGIAVAIRLSPCLTVAGWENGKPPLHVVLANEHHLLQLYWRVELLHSFPQSFCLNTVSAYMYLVGHAGLHTSQALTQVAVVSSSTEHSR